MYNIAYDRGDGTVSHYLMTNVDIIDARKYLAIFIDKYIGKPYPNGKGAYPFTNARIVKVK